MSHDSRSGTSSLRGNLLLLLVTTLICLAIAEMAVRFLYSTPEFSDRFLLWSSPHYRLDNNGAVRYLPNESVREITVYYGEIEYDIRYSTNDMGLIDHRNYASESKADPYTRRIAFVGDSLTAGQGAEPPWVPQLRDRVQTTDPGVWIYNLGVSGAGVQHFRKLLQSLGQAIDFDEIVLLAISNDFYRPFWWPLTRPGTIRFCLEDETRETCAKRTPIATVIDANASEEDILARVENLRRQRTQEAQAGDRIAESGTLSGLLGQSRLFMLLYDIAQDNPLFAVGEKDQRVSRALKDFVKRENFQALEGIRADFPDIPIRLVHLPERHEVQSGRYDLEDLGNLATSLDIEYFPALNRCEWSASMYHPNDPHPNERGYATLSACIEAYLFPEERRENPQ